MRRKWTVSLRAEIEGHEPFAHEQTVTVDAKEMDDVLDALDSDAIKDALPDIDASDLDINDLRHIRIEIARGAVAPRRRPGKKVRG